MTIDRRTEKRISRNLSARWDTLSGAYEARIGDISLSGCFVDTNARVVVGEIISLEIGLATGEWLRLRGEITSHQEGVGFGLRFDPLTDAEENKLRELVEDAYG